MNIYLVLTSLLCLLLYITQAIVLRDWGYRFMVWNLFLAWIPFIASTFVVRSVNRFVITFWFCIWFLFLPNSFYMLTDFIHLRGVSGLIFWIDLAVIFTFASTGIIIGILSLSQIHKLVREMKGDLAGIVFAFVILCLSGLGVYVGRFLRWNSWDIISDPVNLLYSIGSLLTKPEAIILSGIFALLFNSAYFLSISATLTNNQDTKKI